MVGIASLAILSSSQPMQHCWPAQTPQQGLGCSKRNEIFGILFLLSWQISLAELYLVSLARRPVGEREKDVLFKVNIPISP